MSGDYLRLPEDRLTETQERALGALCLRYHVEYNPDHYLPAFDLPKGWVCGWVGGPALQETRRTVFVGCSPEGEIHS
ncbi:MAG TPA: hypothetical protein VH599_07395 [Ktedonobacterales bacterium]